MKVLFITGLTYIRLPVAFGRGIRLSPDLFLTNDRGEISSLLSARFEKAAGSLETSALKNANAAVYSITEYPDKELENHESARLLLIHRMRQVQHFLNCLWFLKDNSANFELGFQEYPFRSPYGSTVTSNFLAIFASKADGSRDFTEFNASEVRAARDISVKLFGPLQLNQNQKENHGYIVPEDLNRVGRVLHILAVYSGFS